MSKRKALLLAVCTLLVCLIAVQFSLAWLTDQTDELVNATEPASPVPEITEEFDGEVKKNVNVKNVGNIDAYLRVRLVTYRVDDEGQRIGGKAEIPEFTPGDGWFKAGAYYYYNKPVAPGNSPAANLIGGDGITLEDQYTDADGGKQVIEVVAEAIQSEGVDGEGKHPVTLAWGVTVNNNDTPYDYTDDTISAATGG